MTRNGTGSEMACAVGKQCLVRVISQARFLFIQAVIFAGETLKKRMQKYKLLFALVSWPTLVQICFFNCVNLTVEGLCACGRSCPTCVVAGGRRSSPLLPPPTILSLLLRILQKMHHENHIIGSPRTLTTRSCPSFSRTIARN